MFKNKILNIAIIILVSITLLVGAAVVVWVFFINGDNNIDPEKQAQLDANNAEVRHLSADEVVAVTSVLDSVTTNLADRNHIVNISLVFQLENEATFLEFEKIKDISIKPVVLKLLHATEPEDLFSVNGFDNLTTQLMIEINPILQEGKLVKIQVANFVIDQL